MFGYVKTQNGDLLVKQWEYYRAAYCGLCRSMRKRLGFLTSFSLSYDFALLTVLRSSLSEEKSEIEMRRCPAHPTKKRPMIKENATTDYCAAAAVILTYRKLLDDIADEKGLKKLRARLVKPVFSRGRKKALRRMPELASLDESLNLLLCRLSETEKKNLPSADAPAEIFGEMLGEICAFGYENEKKITSYRFGKALGHWIYLMDAADDLAEDVKKHRYNPLIMLYGEELSESDRAWLENALIAKLMEAEAAFDLMDMSESPMGEGIIKNVLYLGLPRVAKDILYRENGKENSKEKRLKGNHSNERSL